MLGLVVTVPASEAELASDALWALGVAAIEERGGESGTEDDLVELWTSLGDDAPAVARAAEGFPARWRWKVIELDPSVTETWRAHAHAWRTPLREIALSRLARARALGITYQRYTAVLLDRGIHL